MRPEELQKMREDRGLTQAEFGSWLAGQVDAKPYTAQRVSDWENGRIAIPARIVVALQAMEIQRLREKLGLDAPAQLTRRRTRRQE